MERDYSRSSMNGGRLDSRSGHDRFQVYANLEIRPFPDFPIACMFRSSYQAGPVPLSFPNPPTHPGHIY